MGAGAGVGSLPLAHRDLRLGGSAVGAAAVAVAQRLFLFRDPLVGVDDDDDPAVVVLILVLLVSMPLLVAAALALARAELRCPPIDFK